MPIPTSIADLSTSAASNSPAGTDPIGTSLDDYLRTIQAILKQMESTGSAIASSGTISIPNDGNVFSVTGTTTIATISDAWTGRIVVLNFAGILTLTNSAGLVLGYNITTAAGDMAVLCNTGAGVWRLMAYQRADGAIINGVTNTQSAGDNSTKIASTAYADAAVATSAALLAPKASPALTGVPTAPTAAPGTNTTQIATMAALIAQAFLTALPDQTGNAGKTITTDGATASWEFGFSIVRYARTSNTIIGADNRGGYIDITSGTFTQTFDAAATLGSGWWCIIGNSGTGDITLDPDGAETIDSLATYIMYPGERRLIQCDGVELRSIVLNAYYRAWTASDTFTKPPGYQFHDGLIWGGGGSGARNTGAFVAGGGGGGACFPFHLADSAIAATETITIAGTTSGRGTNGAGTTGGNSTLGSLATGYGGGAGGYGAGASTYGGTGGGALSAGVIGTTTFARGGLPTSLGAAGTELDSHFGGGGTAANSGGNSFYGGGGSGYNGAVPTRGDSVYGGAGGAIANTAAAGGVSIYGGNGGASSITAADAGDGVAPGGGGGAVGASGTGTSGDGARGELRMWGVL